MTDILLRVLKIKQIGSFFKSAKQPKVQYSTCKERGLFSKLLSFAMLYFCGEAAGGIWEWSLLRGKWLKAHLLNSSTLSISYTSSWPIYKTKQQQIQQLDSAVSVSTRTAPVVRALSYSLLSLKRAFSQPFKRKCICEVPRTGSIIIFHLSKLWKAKFFVLCDVIFLLRLQGKFEIDHSWVLKG